MIEYLLFLIICVLIYLYSFLYRNLAMMLAFIALVIAYVLNVNLFLALGTLFIFTLIRLNKSGVKDDY